MAKLQSASELLNWLSSVAFFVEVSRILTCKVGYLVFIVLYKQSAYATNRQE